ncbi:MAG TPA: hypothetical protein VNK43_10970 [Gemmatimonadales bacterium]|nr:hypothetical protein [Gemmatimonadales bacterium]
MPKPVLVGALVCAVLGLVLLVAGLRAAAGRRVLGGVGMIAIGGWSLAMGGLAGVMAIGYRGYRPLRTGAPLATVTTRERDGAAFRADVRFADGETRTFELEGSHIYVDAQVVRWSPALKAVGLTSGFTVRSVSGRAGGDDAGAGGGFDVFHMARRLPLVGRLVQVEPAMTGYRRTEAAAQYELVATSSGLVLRKVGGTVP